MSVFVDVMNVLGSRPDGWWRDRAGAVDRLVAALDRWAAERDELVTAVIDGRARGIEGLAHVEVRFAPGGPNAADDAIVELVAATDSPSADTVVTSDRTLAERVRDLGAAVEGARGLRDALDRF